MRIFKGVCFRKTKKSRIFDKNPAVMKNVTIPLGIPGDIMIALNTSEVEFKRHIQVAIALMLFHEGKLTLGKAIQLSGLSRFEFEQALAKNNISVSYLDQGQIMSDVHKLKEL